MAINHLGRLLVAAEENGDVAAWWFGSSERANLGGCASSPPTAVTRLLSSDG